MMSSKEVKALISLPEVQALIKSRATVVQTPSYCQKVTAIPKSSTSILLKTKSRLLAELQEYNLS